jgi:hypothetical protein
MRKLLFLCCIILASCAPTHESEGILFVDPITVDGDLTEWLDIEQSVILNIPDSIVFGKVKQIEHQDSLVFLLEEGVASSVLVFDRSGNFKNQLINLGSGPGEYIEIAFFMLQDDSIVIYDRYQKKLISFLLDDFTKVKEYKMDYYLVGGIHPTGNNLSFLVSDESVEMEIQRGYGFASQDFSRMQFDPQIVGFTEGFLPESIGEFEGDYFLVQPFSDRIYKITQDSLEYITRIDFGNKKIPRVASTFMEADEVHELLLEGSYFFAVHNLLIENSIISFNFLNESIENTNMALIQNGQLFRFPINTSLKEIFLKPIGVREGLLQTVLLPGEYDEAMVDLLDLPKSNQDRPIMISYAIRKSVE